MWTGVVAGDFQSPYEDRRAVNVFIEICASLPRVDVLDLNGDVLDLRAVSRYPLFNKDPRLFSELRDEVKRGREMVQTIIKGIRPKRIHVKEGNHCWRLMRALEKTPQTMQMAGLLEVAEAISMPVLIGLNKDKRVHFAGPYPKGMWLHPGLPPEKNVWVEHGYIVRKKAGYTVTSLMEDRWCSVIVNHCEKLAGPLYSRKLGADYFGIENGNLSIIGEPELGEGIYGGVPHSEPRFMNHRQGFSIVHWDGEQWHPQVVKIRDGRAVYGGKLFKG